MTRRTVVTLVVIAALAGWFVYQRWFTYITNRDPRGDTLVAFGDSITFGPGVAPSEAWPALLARRFDVPIVNAGVEGDTTDQALVRFDKDVLKRIPKVVIIELGGNDLLQQVPLERVRENLDQLVRRAQNDGAAVVLLGIEGPFRMGGLGGVVKQIGKKYNCAYYPNIMKGIMENRAMLLSGDRIHPNSEGHKLIARRVGDLVHRELPAVFK